MSASFLCTTLLLPILLRSAKSIFMSTRDEVTLVQSEAGLWWWVVYNEQGDPISRSAFGFASKEHCQEHAQCRRVRIASDHS